MSCEHIWFRDDRDTWLTDLVFKCWSCDLIIEEAICPECGRYLSASTNVVEALRRTERLSQRIVDQIIGLARENGCLNAIIRESLMSVDDSYFDSSQAVSSAIYALLDKGEITPKQAFDSVLLGHLTKQYQEITHNWVNNLEDLIKEVSKYSQR